MVNYVEKQLEDLNVSSASIVVRMNDFVGHSTGKFTLNDLESIQALREFLDFREIEVRNNIKVF